MMPMTIHDPIAVAQHYFAAVSHGDMETVAALLDPNVVCLAITVSPAHTKASPPSPNWLAA